MTGVAQDEITEISEAAGRRWHDLDPLLPEPGDLADGCLPPLAAVGQHGRPAGLAVCRHQHVPADSLAQTWSMATKFVLTMWLRGPETLAAADDLLGQWREHLAGQPEAAADDTAAIVDWPARDVTGVLALQRHGLQPIAVVAARPAGRPTPAEGAPVPRDLVMREAGPGDLDVVTEMEVGVIRYDAYFGGSIPRPATEALVRVGSSKSLGRRSSWIWLAEEAGRPVALTVVEPPPESSWIAGMTRPGATAYLQTMFVRPDRRGGGTGAALVRYVHDQLDARGIDVTLLHYAQVNPLSAPFWHRMGYRPLWTAWEARPASTLR
jgi:GNAT superfamily N-acetyltransferase